MRTLTPQSKSEVKQHRLFRQTKERTVQNLCQNFIQVCRDCIRAPWMGFVYQVYLNNNYDCGTAFSTYPGCGLLDFWAPTALTGTTGKKKSTYSAVLESIKSRLNCSPKDEMRRCADMKIEADDCWLKRALCIVCIFGQTSKSD